VEVHARILESPDILGAQQVIYIDISLNSGVVASLYAITLFVSKIKFASDGKYTFVFSINRY
jgi:hypothetical protein